MGFKRGDVWRVASRVTTGGGLSMGELERMRVNFSETPLGRDIFLADLTNGADLEER